MKFVLLFLSLPAFAQEFKNLKVLPQDIGRQELQQIMSTWSTDLGFRCTDCHYSPTGKFDDIDFTDDRKRTKKIAREMYQMAAQINQQFFANRSQQISCYTCHHGTSDPRRLEHILLEAYEEGGVTATIDSYRHLRKKFHGYGAYNFGPWLGLSSIAARLSSEQKYAEAVQLHKVNLEFNPNYDGSHFSLGCWYIMGEPNDEKARTHFSAAMKGNSFWTPRRIGSFASLMNEQGKPELGLKAVNLLVEIAPNNADAWFQKGRYLHSGGDMDGARQALQTALGHKAGHKEATKLLKQIP